MGGRRRRPGRRRHARRCRRRARRSGRTRCDRCRRRTRRGGRRGAGGGRLGAATPTTRRRKGNRHRCRNSLGPHVPGLSPTTRPLGLYMSGLALGSGHPGGRPRAFRARRPSRSGRRHHRAPDGHPGASVSATVTPSGPSPSPSRPSATRCAVEGPRRQAAVPLRCCAFRSRRRACKIGSV